MPLVLAPCHIGHAVWYVIKLFSWPSVLKMTSFDEAPFCRFLFELAPKFLPQLIKKTNQVVFLRSKASTMSGHALQVLKAAIANLSG